jgi:hypothetical protein
VAVFESDAETMKMSAGATSLDLPTHTTIWIANFPLLKREDTESRTIEDGHHWLDVVEPAHSAKKVEARTTDSVVWPKSKTEFHHPCGTPEAIEKAHAEWMKSGSPQRLKRYIPPDTDPCFMVRE